MFPQHFGNKINVCQLNQFKNFTNSYTLEADLTLITFHKQIITSSFSLKNTFPNIGFDIEIEVKKEKDVVFFFPSLLISMGERFKIID